MKIKHQKVLKKPNKVLIKENDTVLIISGKDRGKTGKVEKIISAKNKIIVAGIAIAKKSTKHTKKNPKGGIINIPTSIDISNVALICSKCNKKTKSKYKVVAGKKVRICKNCKEQI